MQQLCCLYVFAN